MEYYFTAKKLSRYMPTTWIKSENMLSEKASYKGPHIV